MVLSKVGCNSILNGGECVPWEIFNKVYQIHSGNKSIYSNKTPRQLGKNSLELYE